MLVFLAALAVVAFFIMCGVGFFWAIATSKPKPNPDELEAAMGRHPSHPIDELAAARARR